MSLFLNAAIVICVVSAVAMACRMSPFKVVMRYFTVLSNVFCAAAAFGIVISRLSGNVPEAILLLKYVGTSAVTVTMMTVFLFLGPHVGYKILLTGPDFWLHLVCPVLAVISFAFRDKPVMRGWMVLYGMIPVIAYAFLYLYKVVLAPEEKRWEDFYGFNRNGRWPLSFVIMIAGSLLISWLLYL